MHFGTTVSIISTLLLTCCQQFVLITLPCFSDQRTILAYRPSASGPAFSGDPRSVRARVRQPRSVTARLDHIRRSHVVDDVIGQLFVRSPLPHRRLLPCREIDERQRRRRKSGGWRGAANGAVGGAASSFTVRLRAYDCVTGFCESVSTPLKTALRDSGRCMPLHSKLPYVCL